MKILIIKLSSMGDIIHTLPAISDAKKNINNIEIDWLIDSSFDEIPTWHANINNIISIPLRQWKSNKIKIIKIIRKLRNQKYDLIIDAQGLLKSAILSKLAKGPVAGYAKNCSRAKYINFLYNHKYKIPYNQHAIDRIRKLFAASLSYSEPDLDIVDYGIENYFSYLKPKKQICLLHGTTWENKNWPIEHWIELSQKLIKNNFKIIFNSSNKLELTKQNKVKSTIDSNHILFTQNLNLSQWGELIYQSEFIITVDSGLGHLAAALNKKIVALFGPTDSTKTGMKGSHVININSELPCSPCLSRTCGYPDTHPIQPPCMRKLEVDKVLEEIFS